MLTKCIWAYQLGFFLLQMPENSTLSGIRIFEAPRGETGFRAGSSPVKGRLPPTNDVTFSFWLDWTLCLWPNESLRWGNAALFLASSMSRYPSLGSIGKGWVFQGCQIRGRGGGCWVVRVTDANLNIDDSLCFPPFLHFVILHLLWNAIESFIS